jgi:hypothetical protein
VEFGQGKAKQSYRFIVLPVCHWTHCIWLWHLPREMPRISRRNWESIWMGSFLAHMKP